MSNDLANLTVQSLGFNLNDIGDVSVHLYGNTLGISEGVFNRDQFECQVYIHCGVTLEGNATFVTGNPIFTQPFLTAEDMAMHFTGPIDLNGHNLLLWADSGGHPTRRGRMYIEGGEFQASATWWQGPAECTDRQVGERCFTTRAVLNSKGWEAVSRGRSF